MDSVDRRIAQLIGLMLDGACSDAERAEWSRLGSQHRDIAAEAVDDAIIPSLLNWHSGSITESSLPLDVSVKTDRRPAVAPKDSATAATSPYAMWAAAAMLLIASGVGAWNLLRPSEKSSAILAELV